MATSRSPRPNQVGSTPYSASSVLDAPGLVAAAPAALEVDPVAERVHDGVEVGAHLEAVHPEVVGGVRDDVTAASGATPGRLPEAMPCRRPCRKRAPPIPPESTVMLRMALLSHGASRLDRGLGRVVAIADPGLTSGYDRHVIPTVFFRIGVFSVERIRRRATGRVQLTGRKAMGVRELFLLDGDAEQAGWQDRALCAQTDPEAFFPEKGGSTREAKKVCLTCEVRDECLESALMNDERFGIWGALRAGASQAEEASRLSRVSGAPR